MTRPQAKMLGRLLARPLAPTHAVERTICLGLAEMGWASELRGRPGGFIITAAGVLRLDRGVKGA